MKPIRKALFPLGLASLVAGCGPSAVERDAAARQRLELEEKARQETVIGNQAITDMTERAFRRRTPAEEAKAQADKNRRVQALLDAQKKANAEAASPKP